MSHQVCLVRFEQVLLLGVRVLSLSGNDIKIKVQIRRTMEEGKTNSYDFVFYSVRCAYGRVSAVRQAGGKHYWAG